MRVEIERADGLNELSYKGIVTGKQGVPCHSAKEGIAVGWGDRMAIDKLPLAAITMVY